MFTSNQFKFRAFSFNNMSNLSKTDPELVFRHVRAFTDSNLKMVLEPTGALSKLNLNLGISLLEKALLFFHHGYYPRQI